MIKNILYFINCLSNIVSRLKRIIIIGKSSRVNIINSEEIKYNFGF